MELYAQKVPCAYAPPWRLGEALPGLPPHDRVEWDSIMPMDSYVCANDASFDLVQEQRGLRADTYTYSLLMNGFAHASRPDMAFKLVGLQ